MNFIIMMNEAVKTIMSTNLIAVSPAHNLFEVRQIFMKNTIHHLPVVEESRLVGILTTYDLWKNEIEPRNYEKTLVAEVMTRRIAKISPDDKIGTAAKLFLDNRFHALPIVDGVNRLVGIITSHDVLKYEYIKEYPKPLLYQHLYTTEQLRANA